MAQAREGIFWDVIAGRRPLPAVLGLLGWHVLEAEPGRIRVTFQGKPDFYNPVGFVQGGILAAMLDGVMGAAAVSLLRPDESITTLDMNLTFMKPVRDIKLVAEGGIVHKGGATLFMDGTLTLEDGSLVARATATGRVTRVSDMAGNEG